MITFFIRALKWMFCLGVAAWFLLIPLLPIYGAFRPWPEATSAIRDHGIQGSLFMIGAGGDHQSTSEGIVHETRQRTYFAFPESLNTGNIFIFTKATGTALDGEQATLTVERLLAVLLILWIAAGLFLAWTLIKIKHQRTGAST
jgi:hypothetical protein